MLGFTLLLAACSPSLPKPPEYPSMTNAPKASDAKAAYETAQAEVTRLRAQADQDSMLAAWPGQYGGVPPWDQAKAERFSAAFKLGLELRKREVEAVHERTLLRDLSPGLIIFGEWCAARHSVAYDSLPDWLIVFDVYDRVEQRFFSTVRRDAAAKRLCLPVVREVSRGRTTLAELTKRLTVEPSRYRAGPTEGFVIRKETSDWLLPARNSFTRSSCKVSVNTGGADALNGTVLSTARQTSSGSDSKMNVLERALVEKAGREHGWENVVESIEEHRLPFPVGVLALPAEVSILQNVFVQAPGVLGQPERRVGTLSVREVDRVDRGVTDRQRRRLRVDVHRRRV